MKKSHALHLLLLLTGCTLSPLATADIAADNAALKAALPGSTLPGVIGRQFESPAIAKPVPAAPKPPEAKQPPLGAEAAKIKFKLVKIILTGNHVYTDKQLSEVYQAKLHHQISVSQLQDITQDITNFYRNNGYILTRAILPPQQVKDGIVKIQILEGYINEVNVTGTPGKARTIVQRYGEKAIAERPLRIARLEHYIYLANAVPGVSTRAVLEPAKHAVGASDLTLVTERKLVNVSLNYDNYGTRYIGPNQFSANVNFNSIALSGDQFRIAYATVPARPKEMQFYDFSYAMLVGSEGASVTVGGNSSATRPQFTLTDVKLNGDAATYYFLVNYPLMRTRDSALLLDGGLHYADSATNVLGQLLYDDHLRTISAGMTYNFADRWRGSNMLAAHVEQGLNVLGASHNTNSTKTSRFGGDASFTKWTLNVNRLQALFGRLSAMLTAAGSYAFQPLLSSEQFSFGGSQLGRGYDSAEIIGDNGLAGSVEIRADFTPKARLIQTVQPYVFYDEGAVWNRRTVANTKQKQSAASIGAGVRFSFNQYVGGNLMIAQPLTRIVSATQLAGENPRAPRAFFQITVNG